MLANSTLIPLIFPSPPVSSHLSLAIFQHVIPKVISVHVLQQVLDASLEDDALLKVDLGDALKHDCKLAERDLFKVGRDVRQDWSKLNREHLVLRQKFRRRLASSCLLHAVLADHTK